MKKSKVYIAAMAEFSVFFCIGIVLLIYSLSTGGRDFQSPYFFPAIIGGFLVLMSAGLLHDALKLKDVQERPSVSQMNVKNVMGVLMITAVYYAVLYFKPVNPLYIRTKAFSVHTLGYAVSFKSILFTIANFEIFTIAFLFALMYFLGVRKWKVLLPVSIITPAVVSIIFRTMLYVLLP